MHVRAFALPGLLLQDKFEKRLVTLCTKRVDLSPCNVLIFLLVNMASVTDCYEKDNNSCEVFLLVIYFGAGGFEAYRLCQIASAIDSNFVTFSQLYKSLA